MPHGLTLDRITEVMMKTHWSQKKWVTTKSLPNTQT